MFIRPTAKILLIAAVLFIASSGTAQSLPEVRMTPTETGGNSMDQPTRVFLSHRTIQNHRRRSRLLRLPGGTGRGAVCLAATASGPSDEMVFEAAINGRAAR
jgi:hypothetical protein